MESSNEHLPNGSPVREAGSEGEDMQVVALETNGHTPHVDEPQSSSSSDHGVGYEDGIVLRVILEVDGVQPMRSTLASAEDLETLKQEVGYLSPHPPTCQFH
jgi:hypothetical protein